jgi:CRP-like cAMP-binding protein
MDHGENRLLQRLGRDDLARLQPHLTRVKLRAGAVLYQPGDAIEHVYFPLGGTVALLAVTQAGEAVETALIGRDGVVGGSVINENWRSFAQAVVQIGEGALRINSTHLAAVATAGAPLRTLVNRYEAVVMLQAQQNGLCHALHETGPRLCRWLLQAQDALESDQIALTQEFLSHMLGVQRTSVSLCAGKLQDAGLIEYSRGHIAIVDRARMEQLACECYAVIRAASDETIHPRQVAR